MKSQDNFCRNLKAALEARGMSQAELARRLNVGRSYVNTYLSGRACPGLDIIDAMAAVLEIPSSWLIDDEPIDNRLEVHV